MIKIKPEYYNEYLDAPRVGANRLVVNFRLLSVSLIIFIALTLFPQSIGDDALQARVVSVAFAIVALLVLPRFMALFWIHNREIDAKGYRDIAALIEKYPELKERCGLSNKISQTESVKVELLAQEMEKEKARQIFINIGVENSSV